MIPYESPNGRQDGHPATLVIGADGFVCCVLLRDRTMKQHVSYKKLPRKPVLEEECVWWDGATEDDRQMLGWSVTHPEGTRAGRCLFTNGEWRLAPEYVVVALPEAA